MESGFYFIDMVRCTLDNLMLWMVPYSTTKVREESN